MIEARITEIEHGFLATLSEGGRIVARSIPKLAFALYEAGVRADTAHCGDWREPSHIGAGAAIALKAALQDLDSPKDIL